MLGHCPVIVIQLHRDSALFTFQSSKEVSLRIHEYDEGCRL